MLQRSPSHHASRAAQVEIERAVFIQSIEIGENCGPFSIVSVKALDISTGLWQTLYAGEADSDKADLYKTTNQYNRFTPSPLCQTTFAASTIRIEQNTYAVNDWYVKVNGATEPQTDPT